MTHHARESSHAFASVACFKLVLPVEREPTPACVVLGFMAVAWGSKEFLAELGDVEKLLSFSPNPQLQASLVSVLLKKLQSAENLVAGEYVQMLQALEQCMLDEETKKGLSEAILLRASGGSGESGHKLVKVPQVLKNPVAYLTKGEIVSLMQGDIKDVPMVIARRLRLVGLTSLKESTKKAAVTLHVQAHLWQNLPQPTADRIYSMAGEIQDLFLSLSYQAAVAPFKTYPDDPKDLGPAWISKAYGGDQPSCASLPQLTVLGKSCPVRTTSRLLKSGSGHMSSSMNMLGMECKQKTWLELMKEKVAEAEEEAKAKQLCLASSPAHMPSRDEVMKQLQLVTAETETPTTSGALQVPPTTATPGSSTEQAVPKDVSLPLPNDAKSLEQYEAEALEQLESKKKSGNKSTKDPQAKSKGKAIMKKPAAKAGTDAGIHVAAAKKATKKPCGKSAATKGNTENKLTCYGCARCRGNVLGCENCNFDGFTGARLNGRAAWRQYMEDRKVKASDKKKDK